MICHSFTYEKKTHSHELLEFDHDIDTALCPDLCLGLEIYEYDIENNFNWI